MKVRACPLGLSKCQTIRSLLPTLVVAKVPAWPIEPRSALPPYRYAVPCSDTDIRSIDWVPMSGISRFAPWKTSLIVMFSVTCSEPSGATAAFTVALESAIACADAVHAPAITTNAIHMPSLLFRTMDSELRAVPRNCPRALPLRFRRELRWLRS